MGEAQRRALAAAAAEGASGGEGGGGGGRGGGGGSDGGGGEDGGKGARMNVLLPEDPESSVNVLPAPSHSSPFQPSPHESYMLSVHSPGGADRVPK